MKNFDEVLQEKLKDPQFRQAYEAESEKYEVAATVRRFRESTGLSQRGFAQHVGKPQSTISKIERAEMNVSVGLLNEIFGYFGKKIRIEIVPKESQEGRK